MRFAVLLQDVGSVTAFLGRVIWLYLGHALENDVSTSPFARVCHWFPQAIRRAPMLRRSSSIAVIFVASTRPDRELISTSFKASSAAREMSA